MSNVSTHLTGLATALFAALIPTLGYSQQTSPSMCYVPGSGTAYVIQAEKAPSTCRSGHVALQLTTPGSAGPQLGPGNSLPTNSQGAFDLFNVNGLVAGGTWGTGNIPATGSGTRLMWYPRNAAFRAGMVFGDYWDNVNVGSGSVAFGHNTKAGGQYAFAAGTTTIANGNASFAMGDQSAALGAASTAIGYKAKATHPRSVALGGEAVAQAPGAVAVGSKSQAWGENSTAIFGTATGFGSIAIGELAEASGYWGTAIGHGVKATGWLSIAMGHKASTNFKEGTFVYGDASTLDEVKPVANSQFVVRAQKIWLGTNNNVTATANRYLETSTGAYLSTGGAWVSSSDSAKKYRWQDVDGETVLEKLGAMPVRSWSYREEGDSVRHVGPTAQDFRNAFGLGDTDKAIASVDADGVSLAGIKALVRRTDDLRRQNGNLRRENEDLRAMLGDVLRRLAELEAARR